MLLARSRPQPSNLQRMESLDILTIRSRPSSSLFSLSRHLAAMHSQVLGILERTAQLPMRARTSTMTKPGRCIAEGLRAGCPNSAPAPERPGPEKKASSPRARIVARGSPLASKLRSKFLAEYDAEADTRRWPRIPARHGQNRALLRLELPHAQA